MQKVFKANSFDSWSTFLNLSLHNQYHFLKHYGSVLEQLNGRENGKKSELDSLQKERHSVGRRKEVGVLPVLIARARRKGVPLLHIGVVVSARLPHRVVADTASGSTTAATTTVPAAATAHLYLGPPHGLGFYAV